MENEIPKLQMELVSEQQARKEIEEKILEQFMEQVEQIQGTF